MMSDPSSPPIDLSIVIPVYNEVENIGAVVRDCDAVIAELGISGEIIVADDGSTDGTRELLPQLAEEFPRLRPVLLPRNMGQTPATAAAIYHARGEIIVGMDGDGQNEPRDIPMLLQKIDEGYDVVSGWRENRQDKLLSRKLPSKVANAMIAIVTGVPIRDNGCSLKAYRATVLKSLRLYSDMHRFLPGLCAHMGARVTEVPVRHHARLFGESKYGLSRIWKVLVDMLSMKVLMTFSTRPALWFSLCALPIIFLATIAWTVAAITSWTGSGLIVFPTLGLLLTYLAFHLIVIGLLGEAFVNQSDFREVTLAMPLVEEKW